VDRVTGRSDCTIRVVVQVLCYIAYQRRRDQRFIALYVDHDSLVRPVALFNHLRDALGAAGVGFFGQAGFETVFVYFIGNCMMVGGDPDLLRPALRCLFSNPDHHRFARDKQ